MAGQDYMTIQKFLKQGDVTSQAAIETILHMGDCAEGQSPIVKVMGLFQLVNRARIHSVGAYPQ